MLTIEDKVGNSGTIIENGNSLESPKNQIMKSLNLSVVHKETQKPVSNALISIESIGKTAVCNSRGEVCLTDLMPGEYLVDVISPGFVAQTVVVSVSIDEPVELKVKMESNC